MSGRTITLREQIISQLLLAVAGAFVLLPVLWMLRLAFEGGMGGRPDDARLIPLQFTWEHIARAATEPAANQPFARLLFNSLAVALGTALTAVVIGASAAYGLARYRFPGRRPALFATLVLATLPPAALATPFFIYLNGLGIRQTLEGLVLVYGVVAVPFAIWTIRNAVQGVGRDLEEAAMLEGAGPWKVFSRVTLPLIAPSVGAAAFIAFLIAWSEYALAWALISDPQLVTLAMALYNMRGNTSVSWGLLSATALLVSLPVLALFYALGRYVLDGLTLGAARR
jgi:arabinogalactan oligomer/maltooligosaccharide transport system permease protein